MKTITISREFFCYARDITEYCNGLPDFVTRAYCIAVVQKDERTHICSMTPSSRVSELRNEFLCSIANADKMQAWLESSAGEDWTYQGLDSCDYYGYIEHDESSEFMTEAIEFSDDFDVPDSFDPENDRLPDDVNEALWEEAIENFQGNHYTPECVNYYSVESIS